MARQPFNDRKPAEISDREELIPGVPNVHDRRSEAERTVQGESHLDRHGQAAGRVGKK